VRAPIHTERESGRRSLGLDGSPEESLWVRLAGGRLAIQYLERAGEWGAMVDESIARDLEAVRRRLLDRINALDAFRT
jgi:hypothetical protein